MTADDSFGRLDDDAYPAYTMGRAADMLGTTQGFLRAIEEARLITPLRSAGGHRRYFRYQLRIAARARELVDRGAPSRPPAASSSSRTSSKKPSASTPNTAAPPNRRPRLPRPEAVPALPLCGEHVVGDHQVPAAEWKFQGEDDVEQPGELLGGC